MKKASIYLSEVNETYTWDKAIEFGRKADHEDMADREYERKTETWSRLLEDALQVDDFDHLDDWSPSEGKEDDPQERLEALGEWINEAMVNPDRETQRILFWNWFNAVKLSIEERIRLKIRGSVNKSRKALKPIEEYIDLLDAEIERWNGRVKLFGNRTPSFRRDLQPILKKARNWAHHEPVVTNKIAMGEMIKVKVKGVVHIVPREALDEFPQLREMVVQ